MEDIKKDRKKIIKVLSLIISIILIIALATYAWITWSSKENTELTMTIGELAELKFITGNDITTTNLAPVLDYNDGKSTTFSIKSKSDTTFESDVILNVTSIDSALQNETFKYVILESSDNNNFNIINEGTFKDVNTGINVIGGISIQPKSLKYYKFIMYIDSNMENDVNMMGKSISGTLSVEASYIEPNAPKLTDGLIPVTYDESSSSWVKADSNNTDNSWYDYVNKKWANAVLVTSTNRSTYQSASNGTEIVEDDILAYYVWIPRYKYRVWNINKEVGVDSYNAYHTGIDILFETGTASTGTITCNDYSFVAPTADTPNQTCSGTNGEYYTHPAFTFGDTEVEGIWIGKFEISSSDPIATDGGGTSTTLGVRIKPNVTSWRNNPVSNFSYVIQNMQTTDNEYGLTTDKIKTDSHMMKNMEWGAVAYLTNSNYGRCSGGTCTEVTINNSSSYITGNAGNSISASGASGTTNTYNTSKGQLASTTGNIYGVYDMRGGAWEYVMGNMSSGSGSYTYYAQSAGSNFSYSAETSKYIDTYAYGTSRFDQTAYNRVRLGDATGENVLSTGGTGGWYGDYAYFVSSYYPWFSRGGVCSNGSYAGVFNFDGSGGDAVSSYSARAILLVL